MTLQAVEIERTIHDIHAFFTEWVSGRCPGEAEIFKTRALDRIADDWVGIFPVGRKFGKKDFEGYMSAMYASNPDFRIRIRNVEVPHLAERMAVANYQEWQRNARDSDKPDNGRIVTMVLGMRPSHGGIQILQVHETWLPEEIVAAEDFDF